MDPFAESVSKFYFSQGALGVTVLVVGWIALKLWAIREKDRETHKLELAAKDVLITQLQNQRLEEALASRDAVRTLQHTLDAFLQAVRGKGLQS